MPDLTTIGFDADDTLWENERFFQLTEHRFRDLLAGHAEGDDVSRRLLEAERRNLSHYGFGIKGFTLSMIETALEIGGPDLPAATVSAILAFGRELGRHPLEPLPDAEATLRALSGRYRLVLVTKGDLFDQERKLAQSGLGDLFQGVEIVADKTVETYRRVFARHGDGPERAMMVGNSLRSDVLPALAVGAFGVHVPHAVTWAMEHAEAPAAHPRFHALTRLGELPGLLERLVSS